MRMRYAAIIIAGLIFSITLGACADKDASDEKNIIAYVNKEPIFDYDLKKEIALRAKQDPTFKITPDTKREQLDIIINRKLIIQDAMKKGLAKEERFVNTIKGFWEQALIRDFIDYKKREFKDFVYSSDEDVKKYYNNLGVQLTLKVLRSKDKKYIDEAYVEFMHDQNTTIIPWQAVGPVGYEDIGPGVLLEAFSMREGDAKVLYDPPDYYLIMVAKREKKALEPLDTLKPQIETLVVDMKEKRLFEDWLKEERKKAKIKIIEQ